MFGYILKRLAQSFWVLIGITIITFVIVHLAPGSPVGEMLNPKVSPEVIEKMRKNFHLDEPLYRQYYWWWRNLLTNKLTSLKDGRNVLEKIGERLPATIALNAVSMVIIFAAGIPLGIFSATKRYTTADHVITLLAFMGISMPGFWLGYMTIVLMEKVLGVPVLGIETHGLAEFIPWFAGTADRVWHLFLPSLVLATGGIAYISRYMRGSYLEVARQDYMRTARAKGLAEDRVIYKHGLRNALMPIITIFGFLIPGLIGGSVIMEWVFAWPGIGRLGYDAVMARDYPTVVTLLAISAVLVLIGNIIADVLYAVVDPRVRYR